jgi:hypothetical protein
VQHTKRAYFSYTNGFLFLKTPILFKRKVDKNLAVFGEPKTQVIINESDVVSKGFGLGLEVGVPYDLPKDFFIEARYGFGLTNQINGNFLGIENRNRNVLRIGLGLKL